MRAGTLVSTFGIGLALALTAQAAKAGTVTDINISPLLGDWTGEFGGSAIAAAPTNGNTGTGITFGDWSGHYGLTLSGASTILSTGGITLNNDASVNALMNSFFGGPAGSVEATITFLNSNGGQATYSLIAGQTIRDYNNGGYNNVLQGYNSASGLGNVTTQPWWTTGDAANNGNGEPSQRLDVQTFVLPSSWAGTGLISMTINNPISSGNDVAYSALQVVDGSASVPEPMSLALLGSALGTLALARRARRKAD